MGGRAPKRPDSALTQAELERRNRRRARNREAAERQRNRRVAKVATLEDEVAQLRKEKEVLSEENKALKDEIEKYKFQLQVLERNQVNHQQSHFPMTTTGLMSPISACSNGQILVPMATTDGQLTPIFTVGTPVFTQATAALNQPQFQFPPTTKTERTSSSGSTSLERLMTSL